MDRTMRMMIALVFALLAFVGCQKPDLCNNNKGMINLYEVPVLGLSIAKPDTWDFITAKESRERISSTKLEDEDMEKIVLLFASQPIVSILKERRQIPLPAVQITVNPDKESPNISAADTLRRLSKKGPEVFKDYNVVHQPQEVEIDGHKAAYMKAFYTGQFWDNANLYLVSYETWIVPRQGYFFMISAVSGQNEDGETRNEISSIIKSIKLE